MTMNTVRVQIHLKFMTNDTSIAKFHNFWYAFEPSKLLTIRDIVEDIRLNYIKNQIYLCTKDKDDEQTFLIHLNDCQLLPFSSSQILRDNDQLVFMPLKSFKLHNRSLQDSLNLNLSSSISGDPTLPATIFENSREQQPTEFIDTNNPLESTSTNTKPIESVNKKSSSNKKMKIKSNQDAHLSMNQCATTSIVEEESMSSIVEPVKPVDRSALATAEVESPKIKSIQPISRTPRSVPKESTVEQDITSEQSVSLPSTHVRIRELKSKTPTWKSQRPLMKGNVEGQLHVRFDSDSDEEIEMLSKIPSANENNRSVKDSSCVNDTNNSMEMRYVPTTITKETSITVTTTNTSKKLDETKGSKRTVDLLFEMKQHKIPEERQAKLVKQRFTKKRAQHRKRTLDYFSMANFVDRAFGIDKNELSKQMSPNESHTSSSNTPQSLPTSFNKLARLPLVAGAIENNDKIYDLYPPVTQLPNIQTRIAFKLLELGEDFCPKMSTYKEGTIVNINQTTSELTIELDTPFQTVFDQPSKFYAPSAEASTENLTTIVVPLSDLDSARLLPTLNGNNTA